MTIHGITQHWQSSPHQQGALTGPGFTTEEAVEVVEAGIFYRFTGFEVDGKNVAL